MALRPRPDAPLPLRPLVLGACFLAGLASGFFTYLMAEPAAPEAPSGPTTAETPAQTPPGPLASPGAAPSAEAASSGPEATAASAPGVKTPRMVAPPTAEDADLDEIPDAFEEIEAAERESAAVATMMGPPEPATFPLTPRWGLSSRTVRPPRPLPQPTPPPPSAGPSAPEEAAPGRIAPPELDL